MMNSIPAHTLLLILGTTLLARGGCLLFYKDRCPLLCQCQDDIEGNTVTVSCRYANFTTIPKLPRNTAKFHMLHDLTYIRTIQDSAFQSLPQLRTINVVSRTRWTIGIRAFTGLVGLTTLSLHALFENAPVLHTELFKDLSSLRNISIDSIPINISENSHLCPLLQLQDMSLTKNGLNRLYFGECFRKFRNLQQLSISLNSIGFIQKDDLANLANSKLTSLAIIECELKTIAELSFGMFPHLAMAFLDRNKLKSLPGNVVSNNLSIAFNLSLRGNYFSSLPCAVMASRTLISSLDMRSNSLFTPRVCKNISNVRALEYLDLHFNHIYALSTSFINQFAGLRLRTLKLGAKRIPRSAFALLEDLDHLELYDHLSSEMIEAVFQGLHNTKVQYVKLENTKTYHLGASIFNGLRNTRVKTLILNHCNIETLDNGTFAGLTHLEYIDLSDNRINLLPEGMFQGVSSLKLLNLGNNGFDNLPRLRQDLGISPSLEQLWLDGISAKRCLNYRLFRGMYNLSHLSLSNTILKQFDTHALKDTAIRYLDVSNTGLSILDTSVCQQGRTLTFLSVRGNKLFFDQTLQINPFQECINLEKLYIRDARFYHTYAYFKDLFSNLPKLQILSVLSSNIKELPIGMFTGTENLLFLNLGENNIIEWEPRLFEPLKNLQNLNLEKNKIAVIKKDSFIYLSSLRHIGLANNALTCNCDLVQFRSWVLDHHIDLKRVGRVEQFTCATPDKWAGRAFVYFDMTEADCIDYTALILSLSLTIGFVLVICVLLMAYRYRFHLAYGVRYIGIRYRRMKEEFDGTDYKYDAFVAYCSTDMTWVVHQLIPEIENERGYKLCVHHRDWLAGPSIVDNIMQSIEASRKVILAVSNKFAKSYWCQIETTLSQTRLMEGHKNSMIIVLLEEVAPKNTSSSLRSLLTSQTYLPWPPDEKTQRTFWKRLSSALKRPKRAATTLRDEGQNLMG